MDQQALGNQGLFFARIIPLVQQVNLSNVRLASLRERLKNVWRFIQRSLGSKMERAIFLFESGRIDEAEDICTTLTSDDSGPVMALNLLALIEERRGTFERAENWLRAAIARTPDSPLLHFNLGNNLLAQEKNDAAVAELRRVVHLQPSKVAAWMNLAQAEARLGKTEKVADAYQKAFELEPTNHAARLGAAANLLAQFPPGKAPAIAYQKIRDLLEFDWQHTPDTYLARITLATALSELQHHSAANVHLEALIELEPNNIGAINRYAANMYFMGDVKAAVRNYEKICTQLPPDHPIQSTAVATPTYLEDISAQNAFELHKRWGEALIAALKTPPQAPEHRINRSKIRIGYVSPDLRDHPVGLLLAPVLQHHNRTEFEIFCYASDSRSDKVTESLRASADHWKDVSEMKDDELAVVMRDHGIDIAVDLAGHTIGSRINAFAQRLAPVQVSWLGYWHSTGLPTMDYFLSDPVSTPPENDKYFTEAVIRLPDTRFAFAPRETTTPVNGLPVSHSGIVTFGCLNNMPKINDRVLAVWGEILNQVPNSRLSMQTFALRDPDFQWDFTKRLERFGIPFDRLDLRLPVGASELLRSYHEIDISLDPFPFCGGLTSFESLWMGVPVVTLPEKILNSRQTASMLTCIALTDTIATSEKDYIQIAVELASNQARLAEIRASLRQKIMDSPLFDHVIFTRELEQKYREMLEKSPHE